MKLHFGYILGLAALVIATCAAFFSVYGISQLFAGAFVAVVVMASALEFGKLVTASYLQRFWKETSFLMKTSATLMVAILMIITSAGIYGFLSSAYQQTADSLTINESKVKNITLKKERYDEELAQYTEERTQLSTTIKELSKGLANNVIQYKDKETGNIITTTSTSTRRALEGQLIDAKDQRDKITPKMDVLRDSVTSMELRVLNLKINDKASAELGPLIYISKLMDWPMDKVVNIFIILLVLVFDPMAILLVLATNWKFEQERKKNIPIEPSEKSLVTREYINSEITPLDLKIPSNVQSFLDTQESVKDKVVGVVPPKYFGYEDKLNEVEEEVEPMPEIIPLSPAIEDAFIQAPEVIEEKVKDITVIEPPKVTEPPKKVKPNQHNSNNIGPIIPTGKIETRNDIKEVKQGISRQFSKQIPRRRGN